MLIKSGPTKFPPNSSFAHLFSDAMRKYNIAVVLYEMLQKEGIENDNITIVYEDKPPIDLVNPSFK